MKKIQGSRKVLIAGFLGIVAVSVPLNEYQADVLKAIAYAAMGANGLEHIGGALRARIGNGNPSSDRDDSGSVRVSPEEQG